MTLDETCPPGHVFAISSIEAAQVITKTHQSQNPHPSLRRLSLLSLALRLHLAHLLGMSLLALHHGIALLVLHGYCLLLLLLLLGIWLLRLLGSLLCLRLARLALSLLRMRLRLIRLLALFVRVRYPGWWPYLLRVVRLALCILRVLRAGLALIALLRVGMLHGKLLCHVVLLLLLLLCVLLLGHLLLLSSLKLHLLLHQMRRQLDLSTTLHLTLLLQMLHLCWCQRHTLRYALHLCLLLLQHLLVTHSHLLMLHC